MVKVSANCCGRAAVQGLGFVGRRRHLPPALAAWAAACGAAHQPAIDHYLAILQAAGTPRERLREGAAVLRLWDWREPVLYCVLNTGLTCRAKSRSWARALASHPGP